VLAPLVFFDVLKDTAYFNIVMVSQMYLNLIYRVDKACLLLLLLLLFSLCCFLISFSLTQENVMQWSNEARPLVKQLHEAFGWPSVTLNWHMICHWESVILANGPVRRYWAWVMERFNKRMKGLVYTTNFKNVEVLPFFLFSFFPFLSSFSLLWCRFTLFGDMSTCSFSPSTTTATFGLLDHPVQKRRIPAVMPVLPWERRLMTTCLPPCARTCRSLSVW